MTMQFPFGSPDLLTAELLERKCKAERQRALAGHWSYDLPRHEEMVRQLKAARERENRNHERSTSP